MFATAAHPIAAAVNPVTNKIYFACYDSSSVTVIDGTNNSTTTVAAGTTPNAVAVNLITNKVYLPNNGSINNVTVITPAPTEAIPLNTAVTALPGNTSASNTPTFSFSATSTYSPSAPAPQFIYYQLDTTSGPWLRAANTGNAATTLTATGTSPNLFNGLHTVYFFASDGSDTPLQSIRWHSLGTANLSRALRLSILARLSAASTVISFWLTH